MDRREILGIRCMNRGDGSQLGLTQMDREEVKGVG